jgi:hypothetical protein
MFLCMYKYFMSNISTFHVTALPVTKSVKITWILCIIYWSNSSQDFCHLKYVIYFSPYFSLCSVQVIVIQYIFNFNTASVIMFYIVNIHWNIFNLFNVVRYSLEKIEYCSLENPLLYPILWIRNGWEVTSEEKIATLQIAGWVSFHCMTEWKSALCSRVGWVVNSCRLFSKLWLDYLCRTKMKSASKCLALSETLIILAKSKNVTAWH